MTENNKSLMPLDKPIKIETDSGEFELTINQVKNFVARGTKSLTTAEAFQFLQLCRFNNLNPWIGDAYLVKFGDDCQMITSKGAYMKRAERAGDKYEGFEAGIIVESSNDLIKLEGSLFIDNGEDNLVGGWAKVHRSDRKFPIVVEVSFDEYVGKTREGATNRMWKNKPATMIRKVALCQALREAFPDIYQGLVSEDEVNVEVPYTGPKEGAVVDAEWTTAEEKGKEEETQSTTKEETEPEKEEKPKRRQRRQTHIHKGEEIKTNGITGPTLEAIEKAETEHEEAEKIIDVFLTTVGATDLTFLKKDEGSKLMKELMEKISQSSEPKTDGEEPETEEKGQEDLFDQGSEEMINCPLRQDIEIESTFCQTCPDGPNKNKTCIHFQE